MSDVINQAVTALKEKLSDGIEGSVKFVLNGEGAIIADEAGVRADDGEADVTLSADPDVFQDMMAGDLDPAAAFMTGRLSVEGDMGLAMRLASLLG
jgi:putative sterol carrier protein